jgi:phosphoserine phosphatase
LVSGGFTQFAERVRELCAFDEIRSNRLILADGRITGDLREPILDRDAKEKILREVCGRQGLSPSCAAAVGDGANDLAMVRAAGLGVSFRGKQILRDASPFCIDHGDLTALLYLQGYPREAFAP